MPTQSLQKEKQLKQKSSKTSHQDKREIDLFIAGVGAIGSKLVRLVKALDHPLYEFNIIGLCNSTNTVWDPSEELFVDEMIQLEGEKTDWDSIQDKLISTKTGKVIFVDATGNDKVARTYANLLKNGIHVVTPSKKANTFEQSYFDEINSFSKKRNTYYRYETAVGAALPIISTIRGLVESGDEITEISGVASGTLSYIFSRLQTGVSFSQITKDAKEQGYSEPDPRDDLSGEDVARKFLILARVSGYNFERNQIRVDSLVPEKLASLSSEAFMEKLPEYDSYWKNRNTQALMNNKKLRYVGRFSPDGIEIGVKEVPGESPLGALKGTDNLIQIFSKRYSTSPITVQGPGAGRSETAGGVLTNIVEISCLLG